MVSEKDLQSYLKVAASALPCREARKEFSSYVHNVAHDISIENPDADFATVASLLGTTPKQVAADFVESQSPQTISRWNRSAHRYKYGLQLLVGIIVVVLFSVVIFFTTTKQRCTRGYKRYKETSGLIEWKECQIFHSIFT